MSYCESSEISLVYDICLMFYTEEMWFVGSLYILTPSSVLLDKMQFIGQFKDFF